MTDQLPRPIEPGEIRAGDTVRRTKSRKGITISYELTVKSVDRPELWTKERGRCFLDQDDSWTLLSRPTPAPAVGSRWRHKQVGAEFVVTADGAFFCYKGWGLIETGESFGLDAKVGEFLTPIPDHGDGCSEWLWDEETDTGWVTAELTDDGDPDLGITHVQVRGERTNGNYLTRMRTDRALAGRLRPWSERGQR